jgi:hypothetical protein
MGIAYRSIPQRRLTVEVWHGVITVDQWRTHVQTVLSASDRSWREKSLTDITTADASQITDADQAEIAAMYAPHGSQFTNMRNATIASRAFEPSFEFGRRIERFGMNVIVFNEMVSACSWLGLDPSEIRPVLQELRDAPRNDVSV